MRRWTPFVLVLLGASGALAQDAPPPGAGPAPASSTAATPPSPEQAADEVLAAVAADDRATLAALAGRLEPDPWIVADELMRRGQHAAADALARASVRVDLEALPAYVAARRGTADDPARRERLTRALAALAAQAPQAASDALGPTVPDPVADVVGVRLAYTRGTALHERARARLSATAHDAAGRDVAREAEAAFRAAAEASEELGWIAMASGAWRGAAIDAFMADDLAAALAAIERRIAVAQRRKDPARAAESMAWAGDKCRIRGDHATSLRYFQQALEAHRSLGNDRGAAAAWQGIGDARAARGEYAEAEVAYERARALWDVLGERKEEARMRMGAAVILFASGQFARSLEMNQRALAALEALGDTEGAAHALSNVGSCQFHLGAVPAALEAFLGALSAFEKLGRLEDAVRVLGNVANAQMELGDHVRALESYERALALQRSWGRDSDAAKTLANLGTLRYYAGDFGGALAAYEEALASQGSRGEQVNAANTRVRIASVLTARGDYARAFACLEQALSVQESLGALGDAAFTMASIGRLRLHLGDLDRGRAILEAARARMEKLGDRPHAARTTLDLAAASLAAGDTTAALAGYERAAAMLEAGGDRRNAARATTGLGSTHLLLGDATRALELFERAAAAAEADADPASAANAHANTGIALRRLGRLADAGRSFARAIESYDALGDQAGRALVLGNLGELETDRGDAVRALAHLRASVAAISRTAVGLADEESAGARETGAWVYDAGIRAAVQAKDPAETAFFVESGRAGALLEGLRARAALGAAAVPTPLRLEEAKVRTLQANAAQALRKAMGGKDLGAIRARRAELDAAQERAIEVVARIQREAKAGAALLYPQPASIDELRAALGDGDALVLYALPEGGDAAALVVTKADARIVALGPTKAVDEAIESLALHDPSAVPDEGLSRLAALVGKPLALPATTTRVLVSPAGGLSYVPFAPLLPDVTVTYVPSGTTYRLLREEETLRGEGVLALGDPDYDAKPDDRAREATRGGPGRLVRLPATRDEAKAVGTVTLLGLDATEAGLRKAVATRPRWRAVHLACHGLVDAERPALSSLAVTAGGDDDGFVTCLEVFRSRTPADLVVLSACETGRGKVVRGEGIVGLTRAFMFAGSPRVVCSLWKVDDAATGALMQRFYELWNPRDGSKGLGTAEALRAAQEHVRRQEKWKHPYYWAAWVLWGLPS